MNDIVKFSIINKNKKNIRIIGWAAAGEIDDRYNYILIINDGDIKGGF